MPASAFCAALPPVPPPAVVPPVPPLWCSVSFRRSPKTLTLGPVIIMSVSTLFNRGHSVRSGQVPVPLIKNSASLINACLTLCANPRATDIVGLAEVSSALEPALGSALEPALGPSLGPGPALGSSLEPALGPALGPGPEDAGVAARHCRCWEARSSKCRRSTFRRHRSTSR